MVETKQIISWLWDKAARAQDHSYARMLNMTAKRMRELEEKLRWIPVTESLPQEFVSVLVYIPSESPLPMVKEAYLANGLWSTKTWIHSAKDVTHWMPLPEPPKEDEQI